MAWMTYEQFAQMTGAEIAKEAAEPVLDAACGVIEKWLRRRLGSAERTEERYFDAPADRMQLRAYPVEKIEALTGAEQKHLDRENGILRFEKPACGAVVCRYTGGLEPIPAAILQACALVTQALLQTADNGGKTLMSERLGDYQVMFYQGKEGQAASLEGFSPAAAALLAPYRGNVW